MANIYDDVELLKQQMTNVLADMADTGWLNLTLLNGVQAYNENGIPQYRKIGNKVYLRGAVKNILANTTIIAILPEGFRPAVGAHSYTQNTSNVSGHSNTSRLSIRTDGALVIEGITEGASYGESKWFPIHTNYLVD